MRVQNNKTMPIESFQEKQDQIQNFKPEQENEFLGFSPEEIELLKKAREKYKTPDDLLKKGIGWVKKGPGKVRPQYNITPSVKKPKK